MDLKKIRYFVEVARLKNFSKAAQVLYVSQTAVSQQIAALETELSVELFYRDKKSVQLTLAGEIFLEDAKHLLKIYENAVMKTREVYSGFDGMIKIGFFSMLDRHVIAPVISKFHTDYPKAKLNIVQCNYEDMKVHLLNGTIDIGFTFQIDSKEIEELKVLQTLPKLCVSRNHKLSHQSLIEAKDIKEEHVIAYIRNQEQLKCYQNYHIAELEEWITDESILVESMDDAVMLVNMNAGISFLPELSDFVNPNKVVFINQNIVNIPFEVNTYWIKENQNPVLHNFLDYIKMQYLY